MNKLKEAMPNQHPCLLIAEIAASQGASLNYGNTEGVCRITGQESTGLPFQKWVKETFTDIDHLKPGTIISNEALFCFDEKSEIIRDMTGRDKLQRFRSYSHFVVDGEWKVFTKANKEEIRNILLNADPQLAVISDSGQRHLVFKGKCGTWQLEDQIMMPNREHLRFLSDRINELYSRGFNQQEIISGTYAQHKIMKWDVQCWDALESQIKPYRGSPYFDLACFLMTKHEIEEPKPEPKQQPYEQRQGELF